MKTPHEFVVEFFGRAWTPSDEKAIVARDAEHVAALAQSREECERLRVEVAEWQQRSIAIQKQEEEVEAQLDRAVAILREYSDAAVDGTRWGDRRASFLASLASPSQPEPVKALIQHAFKPHPLNSNLCETDVSLNEKVFVCCGKSREEHVPENAGTTCGACKGKGGFDEVFQPATPARSDRVCGLCGGSGRAK